MTEKSVEERLAALERKVAELEKKIASMPSKDEILSEVNHRLKNVPRKTATGRIR